MAYIKYKTTCNEYAGESFAKTLSKKNGMLWADNEEATYSLVDNNGTVISHGDLVKSNDKKTMSFIIPKSDTTTLRGRYKVFIELSDTDDDRVGDIIAEYTIVYEDKKA